MFNLSIFVTIFGILSVVFAQQCNVTDNDFIIENNNKPVFTISSTNNSCICESYTGDGSMLSGLQNNTIIANLTAQVSQLQSQIANLTQQITNITAQLQAAENVNGDVTFSSLTFSPTTKGIVGTTTNDNATTGYVGEVVSNVVLIGSAVSVSSQVPADITSIALTAGDWDVFGEVWITGGPTTTLGYAYVSVNTASATIAAIPAVGTSRTGYVMPGFAIGAGGTPNLPTAPARVSIASTTVYFLVGDVGFGVSTCAIYGKIYARRVR